MVIQWGLIVGAPDLWKFTQIFPIPFPHKCFNIVFSRMLAGDNNVWEHTPVLKKYDTVSFIIEYRGTDRNVGAGFSTPWVAFGY